MGQKVNPKIFRLSLRDTNVDSSYIEKSYEESTLLIYQDLKIKDFISRLFILKGLLVHTCKTRYTTKSVFLAVSYYKMFSNSSDLVEKDVISISNTIHLFLNSKNCFESLILSLKLKKLNEYVYKLDSYKLELSKSLYRRHSKDSLFNELFDILFVSFVIRNSSSFLVNFLTLKLKSIKTQNKIIFYCKLILSEFFSTNFYKVKGLKLSVKGRFNKSARSRKKEISFGSIPLQTLSSDIDYFQSCAYTSVGTFGVKLWICRD